MQFRTLDSLKNGCAVTVALSTKTNHRDIRRVAKVARLGAMILPGLSSKRVNQNRNRKRPARQFSAWPA